MDDLCLLSQTVSKQNYKVNLSTSFIAPRQSFSINSILICIIKKN